MLFVAGKSLIGLYIGRSGITSAFGAAASLIVVLLWVYYSAQIFLFGAEFTWVCSHRYGSRKARPMAAAAGAETASLHAVGRGVGRGRAALRPASPCRRPGRTSRRRF